MNLRGKLFVTFFLLGVLPLLLFGIFAWRLQLNVQTEAVGKLQSEILEQSAADIRNFVEKDGLELLRYRIGYSYESVPDVSGIRLLLSQTLAANTNFLEVEFFDATGMGLERAVRGEGAVMFEQPFSEHYISNYDYFQNLKRGETFISQPRVTLEGVLCVLVVPVTNDQNKVIGFSKGLLSLDKIIDRIIARKVGTLDRVILVNSNGEVLGLRGNRETISISGVEALYVRGNSMDSIKGLGLGGGEVYWRVKPLELFAKNGNTKMYLVDEWPTSEALAAVKAIQNRGAIGLIIVVVIVILLAFIIGSSMLKPLRELMYTAERIGRGNFEQKVEISTSDEIGELGQVFNKMTKDLKKVEELRALKVRTQALAASLLKEKQLVAIREEFLRNTSHQLRTPAGIIRWNAELLAKSTSIESEETLKQSLVAGVSQLNMILEDLLHVATYNVGYENTVKSKIDIKNILDKAVKKYKDKILDKKIELIRKLDDDMVVEGDLMGLTLIVENLLDNAITYTPSGGSVGVTCVSDQTNLKLVVSDSGIGVSAKEVPLLFSQFYRAKNAIEMKNVGTGLGLFLCRNVVEGHGGRIEFKSELGKGSQVTVWLPKKAIKKTPA